MSRAIILIASFPQRWAIVLIASFPQRWANFYSTSFLGADVVARSHPLFFLLDHESCNSPVIIGHRLQSLAAGACFKVAAMLAGECRWEAAVVQRLASGGELADMVVC